MARLIIERKTPLLTRTREERSNRYNIFRLGKWIDPFPNILGTRPEKMVYAELSRRQIPFIYQSYFRFELPAFDFDKWYRPDFVIPGTKTIIEVQGAYWHSTDEQIEKDAFRFAVFEQKGYKVLPWWDFEIESDIVGLVMREPRLRSEFGKGGRIFTGDERIIDDSAGIRSANQARTDYGKKQATYKTRRTSTSLLSYNVR